MSEPIIRYEGPPDKRDYWVKQAKDLIPQNDAISKGRENRYFCKRFPDGTMISVHSIDAFGRVDLLTIKTGKPVPEKEEEFINPESGKYVLLVEMMPEPNWIMINGTWQYIRTPGGFAVFMPEGDGYDENSLDETPNLKFIGWSNSVKEDTKDPLGIIGQETYRKGWCHKKDKREDIEQVRRVDQGCTAYDGDEEQEEITWLVGYWDIWTYEDNPDPNYAIYEWWPDPGPPDEGFCGYLWGNAYDILGPHPNPEDADYTDLEHLFYYVSPPVGNDVIVWWPRECNQIIRNIEMYNREGCLMRIADDYGGKYYNWDYEWWDHAWEFGIDVVCKDIMLPNTLTKLQYNWEKYYQYWGITYGNLYMPYADTHGTYPVFPYNTIPEPSYALNTIATEYVYFWESWGLYVKDRYKEFFLTGATRIPKSGTYNKNSHWYLARRTTDEIVDFTIVTERMAAIFEGNESLFNDWTYDPWEDMYYKRCNINTSDSAEAFIAAGEKHFHVGYEKVTNGIPWEGGSAVGDVGGSTWEITEDWDFYDFGIFTKKNTGVDKDNNITPDTIEPIYAYSADVLRGSETKVVYGMVLDGKHYRTGELSSYVEPTSGSRRITFEGVEKAKDKNDVFISCMMGVRVGFRKLLSEVEL